MPRLARLALPVAALALVLATTGTNFKVSK